VEVTKARLRKAIAQMSLNGPNGSLAVFQLQQEPPPHALAIYHALLWAGFPFQQKLLPCDCPGVIAFQPETETLLVLAVTHQENFVQLVKKVQAKLVICPKDALSPGIAFPEIPDISIQWLS
jgi:hypothetical protein